MTPWINLGWGLIAIAFLFRLWEMSLRMQARNTTALMDQYWTAYHRYNDIILDYRSTELECPGIRYSEPWKLKLKFAYGEYLDMLEYACVEYQCNHISHSVFEAIIGPVVIDFATDPHAQECVESMDFDITNWNYLCEVGNKLYEKKKVK